MYIIYSMRDVIALSNSEFNLLTNENKTNWFLYHKCYFDKKGNMHVMKKYDYMQGFNIFNRITCGYVDRIKA